MWKNCLQVLGVGAGYVVGRILTVRLQGPPPLKLLGCGVHAATHEQNQFLLGVLTLLLVVGHGLLGRIIGARFDRIRRDS